MGEEAKVYWPRLQVGQTVQFWSSGDEAISGKYEEIEVDIGINPAHSDGTMRDYDLKIIVKALNAVLHGFGVQLRYRGVFFLNDEGVEEELDEDHPFVATFLTQFWGDDEAWSFNWVDFALVRDFENFVLPGGRKFEPYIIYVVEAV